MKKWSPGSCWESGSRNPEKLLNPSELSRELGVSRAAVAQWEVGKTEPTAWNLRKIASVVGVSLEWLGQGSGAAAGTIGAEGELMDLKTLDSGRAEVLKAAIKGKKAEIWRLTSDVLVGAGYQQGDYLVVNTGATAHARDVVLAIQNKLPVFRLFSPPYLYTMSVGRPLPPPTLVDDLQTIVKGVVSSSSSRF